MPWDAGDAHKHDHKADSDKEKRQWSHVANSVLERTGDEGLAVKEANGVIKNRKESAKKSMDVGEFVDWSKSIDANFVDLEVEKIEKAKGGFSAVTAVKDASREAFKDVNMKSRVVQDKKAKQKQTFRNAKYKKFDD